MNLKTIGVAFAAFALLAACGKKEETAKTTTTTTTTTAPAPTPPVATSGAMIVVGSAIGADRKVTAQKESFGKTDTLYVSVDTTATGPTTLKARWTYTKDGQVTLVKEDTQTIQATGPTTSEFHVSKPDGWPAGDYMVEVFVNDQPAAQKRFVVM